MENPKINKKMLGIFLGIIFVIFYGFIMYNESVLVNGEKVFLKTVPVDPRDLLRGDYVILRYQIGQDEKVNSIINSQGLKKGDSIYLSIDKDENSLGTLKEISKSAPSYDQLYIKGVVGEYNRIELGIEKFYIPEGRGREIESQRGKIEVLVSIDKIGTAKIVDLYKDGNKIKF